MTTNSEVLTEPKNKTKQNKNELSKQLTQKQNHRNADHMEGSAAREWVGEKGTGNK